MSDESPKAQRGKALLPLRAGTHHTHRRTRVTKDTTLVLGVGDVSGKPVQTLVETLAGGGAGGLDEPVTLADGVEAKLVSDLGGGHGVGEILLVGEDEQNGVAELVLLPMKRRGRDVSDKF